MERADDGASGPCDSLLSSGYPVTDYARLCSTLLNETGPGGQRTTADGHVRAPSEHTQSSSGTTVPPVPALMTHESSNGSFPNTFNSSSQSSVSSVARRIIRGGPDLRLINASKSGLAERFGSGDGRRKSLGSLAVLKKVKTYEDPNEVLLTLPSSETIIATVPEPTPPSQLKSPHWFRALKPEQSTQSPTTTPTGPLDIPVQQSHVHSKSENLFRKLDASTDYSCSEYAESLGNFSNRSPEGNRSPQSSQKPNRPRFPHWRSHSSHFLKRGKPQSQTDTENPPEPGAQTPLPVSDDSHKQLSQESPRKLPKRSIKPWRWRGPLTSSDAQSIADVINTPELSAIHPQLEDKEAPLHAQTPLPSSHKQDRRTRFGSAQKSTELGNLELPPPHKGPFGPSQAELFTPNPVSGRREGHSYFVMDETSPPSTSRKHYSPDFIGTALGGLSPEPSPPESPRSAVAPSSPDRDEYFEANMLSHRHSTAPDFVPPGSVRVNTPPDFSTKRSSRGQPAGFFFAGFSLVENLGIDEPRRLREPRSPSSSGFWDSDAVLMSQSPIVGQNNDHDWNDDGWVEMTQQQQRLAPLTTPDPERDWFRVRMDRTLSNEPQSREVDVSSNPAFSWDVPEHLPGSPLCPLSPKHKGGGKGICVYHGRRKPARQVAV